MLDRRFEMRIDSERMVQLKKDSFRWAKATKRKISIADVVRDAIDSYEPRY